MTEADFQRALDRWGSNLDGWPAEAAAAARELLELSPRAAAELAAAQRLDAHLGTLGGHRAPAHLGSRIAASVAGEAAAQAGGATLDGQLGWLGASGWRPAMLGVLLLTAGYLAGTLGGDGVDAELADDVMALAFTDLYAEIDDAQ